jgi:hypothetical protein
MSNRARNLLAVLAGIIGGMFVNSGILELANTFFPPPPGVDQSSLEGMAATMYLLSLKDFVGPFLAHAFGTLVGAIIAIRAGRGYPLRLALPVAFAFFIGGAYMVYRLPAPIWFNIADLTLAYFPMAILAHAMHARSRRA